MSVFFLASTMYFLLSFSRRRCLFNDEDKYTPQPWVALPKSPNR